MLKAVRANKELTITDAEARSFQMLGYDIVSEDGGARKIIMHGHGKTVPYGEYERVVNELAAANDALAYARAELEAAKAELEAAAAATSRRKK